MLITAEPLDVLFGGARIDGRAGQQVPDRGIAGAVLQPDDGLVRTERDRSLSDFEADFGPGRGPDFGPDFGVGRCLPAVIGDDVRSCGPSVRLPDVTYHQL